MSAPTAVSLYLVLWWLVLFVVLPWGIRREDHPQAGNDPGAPQQHGLLLKFAATSVITFAPFALVYWLVTSNAVTLDDVDWTRWFR